MSEVFICIKINSKKDFRKALKILYFKGFSWNCGESLTDEKLIEEYWNSKMAIVIYYEDKIIRYGRTDNRNDEEIEEIEEIKITEENISKLLMIENLKK